jgi:tetratricopeptide (TPR) repeat protein
MDIVEQYKEVAEDLHNQAQFLGEQVSVYESTELGRKRLQEVVAAVEKAVALMRDNPPTGAVAGAAAATAEAPAEAEPEEEAAPAERPEDDEDLEGWLAFLLENPADDEAQGKVEFLEEVAKEEGNWDAVSDILLARVELAEKSSERIALLGELARIYEQEVGDLGKAFTAMVAAGSEDPSDEELINEMIRLAEATELWGDLVAALNEIVPAVEDKALAASLWLRLGRIYHERLDRADYAVSSLWHALEKDPKQAEAWDELATIYKQKEQWVDLAGVIIKRLEATEDKQDRIFFLLELGDLYESRLGNLDEARIAYQEVLQLDPENADALAAQEAVLRQLELHAPLVDLLEKKAEASDDHGVKRDAWREAGQLLRFELDEPKAAAPFFEKLIKDDPDNLEILEILYDIYEETEQAHDFLRVAERCGKLVEDTETKVKIYRRMAGEMQAHEELEDGAADVLEKIIELDPTNEVTFRELEEIYIKSEAWDELVSAYRRHADAEEVPPVRCEILRAMAAVLDEKLEDPKAAAEALQEGLEADSENLQTLVYLSGLLERLEDWVPLADVLSKRAELVTDEQERVELHRRIGEIALEKMGDAEAAEERLNKALEIDPDNVGAMMALVTLYRSREEWLRAATMLTDVEQATGNRMEKARLLYEAGEIHREQLEDMDKAVNLYAKALLADPEHEDTAAVLAEHYYETEQWEDAEPLYDLLLRKADPKHRKRKLELHTRVGLVAKRLKKAEKSIKNLETARDMDPTSLEVLRELADLKFHMESWQDAANLYQAILVAHRDAIPGEELVQVYHRLGSVKMELGEKDKALNLFEKALDVDATYEPSVKAVLLLREEGGDYERVVKTKLAMLDQTEDPEEQRKLAEEIGDLYVSKLDNADQGLDYYRQAVELKPDDRHVLHKMLEIHTGIEQWDQAAEIVLKLAELEENPQIKAKYLYTAALVYRDELKEPDLGMEQMEACLDADPSFANAFEAIERTLTDRADWTELARALRRQFKRLPETAPVAERVSFLDRLGDIYSEKLGEAETALAAYEAADGLDPDSATRNAKMANLYLQAGPDKLDKAIAQHHTLLRQSPYKIQLYKDLTELYIRTKNKDATWCMCAALQFLKKASDKEQLFYERYRPQELLLAKRVLNDQMWRDSLRHPGESSRIDAIFAGVMQAAALRSAQPHKKFGLKRNEKVNPEEEDRTVFQMFVYAARVMDVSPRPELFVRPDQPQPIQVANATEKGALLPTWLVDAQKFEGKNQRETVFEVARQLSHMRPERYLWRALVSQTDLFNVLYAALAIMVPGAPVPDSPEVAKMTEHLKQSVPPLVFEQLTPMAEELMDAGADEANLANWILATQKTALRAALLMTNDFATVAKLVATEPDSVTGLAAKDRVADLLQFSVSPEYFDLRSHLGFAVE